MPVRRFSRPGSGPVSRTPLSVAAAPAAPPAAVIILEGLENCAPRTPEEQAIAEMLRFEPQVRLACQTVVTGEVKLRRLVTDVLEDVDVDSLYVEGVEPCSIGVEKDLLILFADIRGFTPFAENLLHYDVIHVLNLFFQQAGKVIARHGGTINNYMGDGFMALFEADEPSEGALRAVQAGLGLLEAVQDLKPYLEDLYHQSFQIRVGLHYGQVVAGKVGTPGQKKVTVIGDTVNLASRVETANKEAGTQVSHLRRHLRPGQRPGPPGPTGPPHPPRQKRQI